MNFIFYISYWLICIPVLIIASAAVFTSVHPQILNKYPNAIALNNLMILIGIGLLVTIFVIHSWVAGIVSIILSIVMIGIAGRIRERMSLRRLIDKASQSSKREPTNVD
jgi:hypothetical protein